MKIYESIHKMHAKVQKQFTNQSHNTHAKRDVGDTDDGDDDDDDDGQGDCDDGGGDGQLPWESNLWTRCRPSVNQVESKQRWAQPGPTHCLVSTWSAPGLHLVSTWSASTNWSSFVMRRHRIQKMHLDNCKAFFMSRFRKNCT